MSRLVVMIGRLEDEHEPEVMTEVWRQTLPDIELVDGLTKLLPLPRCRSDSCRRCHLVTAVCYPLLGVAQGAVTQLDSVSGAEEAANDRAELFGHVGRPCSD